MSPTFDALPRPDPDLILKIMGEFRADPRPDKIDLGVGVYRDAHGHTPIMSAVQAAQARVLADEATKSYVALPGDPVFRDSLAALAFGDACRTDRLASAATPGGTGAVRQAFELIRIASPDARIWVPTPTWPNHVTILGAMTWPPLPFPYYDPATGRVDMDRLLDGLAGLAAGDVVLLHACCHNPTGADLTPDQWAALAQHLSAHGALPLVDMAYLGFGHGLAQDRIGLETLLTLCPEMLVAVSGSKSFGLYRERVGALFAVTHSAQGRDVVQATLDGLNRHAYAFPPDFGARTVSEILGDADLRANWEAELDGMRTRITANRRALAVALSTATQSDRFDTLADHKGMFSLIGATPAQVQTLRRDHGIYLIDDGRMNLAGLTEAQTPCVAQALAEVLGMVRYSGH